MVHPKSNPFQEVDKVHDPENWTEQLQKIMKGRDPALHYVRAGGRSILFKADVKPAQLSAEPASDDFPLVVISKIAEAGGRGGQPWFV